MAEVKNWASILDENTRLQAEMLSRSPAVAGHVALMPDAHFGIGATVGSVIPTRLDTIMPSAVGVDIGCGMIAVRLNKELGALPADLQPLIPVFEKSIPAGMGQQHRETDGAVEMWFEDHPVPHESVLREGMVERAKRQLGTLGSGNHFVEVCIDENKSVWVVLHSGSRGIGNTTATFFIRKAKQEIKEAGLQLENADLAYLQGDTFEEYITAMRWSQQYAFSNREFMMDAALKGLRDFIGPFDEEERINCHHNFSVIETHFGDEVWLTRKGAIKADVGDMGIIPGSMGAATYIVEGKGNPDSYNSSAHGAGRMYSRTKAKAQFSTDSLNALMKGKAWNKDKAKALVDEHPQAYKPIDVVMEDQKDLVGIRHTLYQVLNYKGA